MPRPQGIEQALLHLAAALGGVAAQGSEIKADGVHQVGSRINQQQQFALFSHLTGILAHDWKIHN
ncbi:MAG: hypothetical protein HC889_18550 [Synechococcaceae cyanobacterium SM1_2_3]|nr:hypothetical protein [Synechococcaceae cyanobacterium SM1_2_3]